MNITEVATVATPVILAAGFYFAWRQFDAIRKARMAQLTWSLYERWNSPLLERARRKLREIGNPNTVKEKLLEAEKAGSPEISCLVRVANFFDTVGALVLKGYLDKDIAYELAATPFDTYKGLYSTILRDPDLKDFLKCFVALDEIFTKIKATRSKTKAAHP
jgi:hypothetical protein